jgi:hypothetical protein
VEANGLNEKKHIKRKKEKEHNEDNFIGRV